MPHFIFSSLYFTSAFLFLLVSAFYFTITLFCFILFYSNFFFFFGCRCFFRSRLRLASFLVLAAFNFALLLLCFCLIFALFLLYFFYSLQPTSLPRYFFPDSIFFVPIGLQRLFSVNLFRPAFSCMENHLRPYLACEETRLSDISQITL